jgi:hypothetical protein
MLPMSVLRLRPEVVGARQTDAIDPNQKSGQRRSFDVFWRNIRFGKRLGGKDCSDAANQPVKNLKPYGVQEADRAKQETQYYGDQNELN